jgi:uncharacterized membrane protein YphA (DoxX/SURF4 family)
MRLPHSLRIVIFLLRIVLGMDFLFLGVSVVFQPGPYQGTGASSFGDLHAWLAGVTNANSLQTVFAWAFMVIGACLIVGLIVRLASLAGVALAVTSMIPVIDYRHLNILQFTGDGIIAIVCLLILFVTNAGTYIGLDQFFHVRLSSKNQA